MSARIDPRPGCAVDGCVRLTRVGKVCDMHKDRKRASGSYGPPGPIPELTLEQRFWRKVDQSAGPDSCWPWRGVRAGHRYGQVTVNGRHDYAHRLSYELARGPIPEGMLIQHSCDNRPCVNPAHLSVGTVATNAQDMMVKGRHRTALKREEIEQVLALRAQRVPYAVLAPRFGRTVAGLSAMVNRELKRRAAASLGLDTEGSTTDG